MKKKKVQQILSAPIEEKHQLMNNIDTIDLEDELFEHFRFEVPRPKHPCELINTMSLIQNATRNKIQTAQQPIFFKRCYGKIKLQGKANDVVRVMLTHPPTKTILFRRIYRLILCMKMIPFID
jgi:hypothetical protein